MTKKEEHGPDEWELIHAYTRKQALVDGTLVDATELAREAGFTIPVALTAAVHAEYVRVPDGVTGQDETGRLWDILWMLRVEIRRSRDTRDELHFELLVRNDDRRRAKSVTLKSLCGPDDDGEPVITIMLPSED